MTTRIRFNPVTRDVEIEGSEDFVKAYFKKIQKILSEPEEVQEKIPVSRRKKAATAAVSDEETAKGKVKVEKAIKRITNFDSVLTLILKSQKGITTTELMGKTGLTQQQIWGVIYRAEKEGKIAKAKRGLYIAVIPGA